MEEEIIKKLEGEGYEKVYVYDAPAGETDEEHEHDFDTKLVVIKGEIQITSSMVDATYKTGSEILIPRNTIHSAKVGPDGCRYVVAEKH